MGRRRGSIAIWTDQELQKKFSDFQNKAQSNQKSKLAQGGVAQAKSPTKKSRVGSSGSPTKSKKGAKGAYGSHEGSFSLQPMGPLAMKALVLVCKKLSYVDLCHFRLVSKGCRSVIDDSGQVFKRADFAKYSKTFTNEKLVCFTSKYGKGLERLSLRGMWSE
jgi:hypothetical protein